MSAPTPFIAGRAHAVPASTFAAATLVAATLCLPVGPVAAQESWNPFADQVVVTPRQRRPAGPGTESSPRPALLPMDGARDRPWDAPGDRPVGAGPASPRDSDAPTVGFAPRDVVEKTELAPLGGPDGAPVGVVVGSEPDGSASLSGRSDADSAALARSMAALQVPSRSAALTQLLLGIAGSGGGTVGIQPGEIVIRAEILYRAGRIAEAEALVAGRGHGAAHPLLSGVAARLALARGDRERACKEAQATLQAGAEMPRAVRAMAIGIQGYCGAAKGNPAAASLAAGLAREDGGLPEDTLGALDAVGIGEPVGLAAIKRIGVLDWRLAELGGKIDAGQLLERAEPALLAVLGEANGSSPALRVTAAEAAARVNAIDPAALAEAYRQHPFTQAELAQALTARVAPNVRRALLFRGAEAERTPFKRTRLVRAALDDAKRVGLYFPVAAALVRTVEEIQPVSEIGWFAETAVEVMLASGRLDAARRWAQVGGEPGGGGTLGHWLALIDIADPAQPVPRGGPRGASLASVEDVALRGRFTPDGLHRLATVLDAFDYHVPMRLWEAASRSPQPTTGHLPATGVLSDLQDAAKRKDQPRTVALVFQALGVQGPEGAHMIALGDAIRALRRAGMEREARGVAVEALFALWPRTTSS